MGTLAASIGVAGVTAFTVLALIVSILWCLMSFFILGTNKRLDKIIKQNSELIDHLKNR